MTAVNGNAVVYRNVTPNRGHWIGFQLEGVKSNRFAVGARVTVEVGERRYVRELFPTNGFSGQSTHRLHVGIGAATAIDRVEIRWPSGLVQEVRGPALDRYHTIREAVGVETAAGADP